MSWTLRNTRRVTLAALSLFIAGLCLAACTLDTAPVLNTQAEITGFDLYKSDNPSLPEDVFGAIDGNTITLTVPAGADVGALSPNIDHTGASVSPGDGVAQDFSGPVTYTVTAADGSTRGYTVRVQVMSNSSKDITRFTIDGKSATIKGSEITLTLPYGSDPTQLTPRIEHTGQSVSPASDAPQDFQRPVSYTVTAADGSTRDYIVTVSIAPNNAKEITDFQIAGIQASISATTITLTLPFGSDLTSLTPTIDHTGASIQPASGAAQDFSKAVSYTVTAADGSTRTYTVMVAIAASDAAEMTQFILSGVEANIMSNSIAVTVPYGTDVSALAPTLTHTGASVQPASGEARDFSSPQMYVITAQDGSTRVYTVTVTIARSSAKEIARFRVLSRNATINGTAITLSVPYNTDVSSLSPTIVHTGASITPASGQPRDFTQPVVYTVTAADGTSQQYTVTISVARNDAKDITSFQILGNTGTIGASTIALTVPFGTNVTSLMPTVTTTGASVSPESGMVQNFSAPVTYTVTAEDGSTKSYVVTVTVAPNDAKEISHFEILGVEAAIVGTSISLTLPFGTDPSALTPTIAITGDSVSPASGVAHDFSSQATYRVTAEDSTFRDYTVTVTIAKNPAKTITRFTIMNVDATIDGTSITLTLPFGTSLTGLIPTIVFEGDSVSPASGQAHDFVTPQAYTVTAANGTQQVYTVTVDVARNPAKDITMFTLSGATTTLIGDNTIDVTMPNGTSLSSLTPTIAISGVSVSPASGVARDFTGPVTYTVTAEDETTKIYTVTVTAASM